MDGPSEAHDTRARACWIKGSHAPNPCEDGGRHIHAIAIVIVGPQERGIARKSIPLIYKLTERTSCPTWMDLLRLFPLRIAKSTRDMRKRRRPSLRNMGR